MFSTQVPGAPPPDVQFKEQGYLFLASAQGEATLRRNQATQAAQGVSWTRLLSPEAAAALPTLSPTPTVSLTQPQPKPTPKPGPSPDPDPRP